MKLLHVITGMRLGGAETVLCRLIGAASGRGLEHAVVVLGQEDVMSQRVRNHGAELIHLNMKSPFSDPSALFRLRQVVRRADAKLVHAWMYHANIAASLAGGGSPVLWSIRHSLSDLKRERWTTRLAIRAGAILSSKAAAITYNSSISRDQHEAIGYCPSRVQVIPNGIDVGLFKPSLEARTEVRASLGIPESAFVVGLVARFHPLKGHANFIQAAAAFHHARPSAHFVLAGSGITQDNAELDSMLAAARLPKGHFHLLGERSDVHRVNACFDIATLSSSSEAFPNSIVEAMACTVPCVATDVGDVREIIGETGIVVPANNPAELCSAWRHLAERTPEALAALGQSGRRRIEARYSLQRMTENYLNLYGELTGVDRCVA